MPLVVGWNDIKPEQIDRPNKPAPGSPGAVNTTFFRASASNPHAPTAAINRYPAGQSRYSTTHFNEVDQFLVVMEGRGAFGRRDARPFCIHFSRAHTPYGPLQSDGEEGWAFMVLRTRFDPGAQRFPESYEKLKRIPNRHPWQATVEVTFPSHGAGIRLQDVPEISDNQGVFAMTLTMDPNSRTTAPEPAGGDGQYVVVVRGSLVHDNRSLQPPAVVFLRPGEPEFQIETGTQGLEAIIMNFPKVLGRAAHVQSPSVVSGFAKWQCELCSFAYDEGLGMPNEGIPARTRWADVPASWSCPDCGADRRDFQQAKVVNHRA